MKPSDLTPEQASKLLGVANGLVRRWYKADRSEIEFDDMVATGLLAALEGIEEWANDGRSDVMTYLVARARFGFKEGRYRQIPGPPGNKGKYQFLSLDQYPWLLDAELENPERAYDLAESNALSAALTEALGALTDEAREAVWLHYGEGWSRSQVAEHLGRTPGATSAFLDKQLRRLQRHPALHDFAPEGYDFFDGQRHYVPRACPSCGYEHKRGQKRGTCDGCEAPVAVPTPAYLNYMLSRAGSH